MNYASEQAIGICRFSFCGMGDWRAYRSAKTSEQIETIRTEASARLYAPERMALRFFLFENFLVPSLKAQSDRNFICLILTSERMPQIYRRQLETICARTPNLELLVSDAPTVHEALWPRILQLNTLAGHPLVQFRVDDDDCLSSDYVHKLRGFMNPLGDLLPVGYSRSNGLVLTRYGDEKVTSVYKAHQPFNSIGTAIRVHGERTIFSFGHSALQRRFAAITDNSEMGYISIKMEGHDSLRVSFESPHVKSSHSLIDKVTAETLLARGFPFLRDAQGSYYDVLMDKIEQAATLSAQVQV